MTETILPCPGCGGAVVVDEYDAREVWPDGSLKPSPLTYRVVCNAGNFGRDDCGYSAQFADTDTAAIDAHNTVAAAVRDHAAVVAERDALRAQVAQLREALERILRTRENAMHAAATASSFLFDLAQDDVEEALLQGYAALAATAPKEADRG